MNKLVVSCTSNQAYLIVKELNAIGILSKWWGALEFEKTQLLEVSNFAKAKRFIRSKNFDIKKRET
jgi:hypothetical protein